MLNVLAIYCFFFFRRVCLASSYLVYVSNGNNVTVTEDNDNTLTHTNIKGQRHLCICEEEKKMVIGKHCSSLNFDMDRFQRLRVISLIIINSFILLEIVAIVRYTNSVYSISIWQISSQNISRFLCSLARIGTGIVARYFDDPPPSSFSPLSLSPRFYVFMSLNGFCVSEWLLFYFVMLWHFWYCFVSFSVHVLPQFISILFLCLCVSWSCEMELSLWEADAFIFVKNEPFRAMVLCNRIGALVERDGINIVRLSIILVTERMKCEVH